MLRSKVGFWPHPQILDKIGTACQGETLAYRASSLVTKEKSFITLTPGRRRKGEDGTSASVAAAGEDGNLFLNDGHHVDGAEAVASART